MSNNPLGQSRYRTYPQQAAVIGKGFLDTDEIEQRQYNAKDGMMGRVYPGGEDRKNFSISKGEVILGKKEHHGTANFTGSNKEVGLSSAAGEDAGSKSFEAMHDDHFFMGIAAIDHEYGGDIFGREPDDEGIGYNRSGSDTVENHSFEDWTAQDLLGFALPPPPKGIPGVSRYAEDRSYDNGMNPLAPNIRKGTPVGKPVYYLEKLDLSDFTMNLAGVFWCMSRPKGNGGINDMTWDDYYENRDQYTNLQLEAFAWCKGLCMVAHLAKESQVSDNDIKKVAFEDNTENLMTTVMPMMQAIFRRDVEPGANPNYEGRYTGDRNSETQARREEFHKDQVMSVLSAGPTRGLINKLNRCVGRSLSNTKSGGTAEVLLLNSKVGF